MAMIELVDYNEIYNSAKSEKKKSTRRSRKSNKTEAPVADSSPVSSEEE